MPLVGRNEESFDCSIERVRKVYAYSSEPYCRNRLGEESSSLKSLLCNKLANGLAAQCDCLKMFVQHAEPRVEFVRSKRVRRTNKGSLFGKLSELQELQEERKCLDCQSDQTFRLLTSFHHWQLSFAHGVFGTFQSLMSQAYRLRSPAIAALSPIKVFMKLYDKGSMMRACSPSSSGQFVCQKTSSRPTFKVLKLLGKFIRKYLFIVCLPHPR